MNAQERLQQINKAMELIEYAVANSHTKNQLTRELEIYGILFHQSMYQKILAIRIDGFTIRIQLGNKGVTEEIL